MSPHGSSTTDAAKTPEVSSSPTLFEWAAPLVVLVVGVMASLLAFAMVRSRERTLRRLEFERRAAEVASSVRSSFDVPLEVLESVPSLFAASQDVTRFEFRDFVNGALQRHPCVYALEWIPRVPGGERSRYELAAVADGLTGYHFKQDAPAGPPVPAAERSEYFPLYYMEPPNPIAIGIEETALPSRRAALELARDQDRTIMTEGLRLVQDAHSVHSVIAFHPVYRSVDTPADVAQRRRDLRGFAAAVFRIAPALAAGLPSTLTDRFDVVLADVGVHPSSVLFESREGASEPPTKEAVREQTIAVAGRRWAVRLSDRTGWVRASDSGWIELGVGGLISALGTGFAFAFAAMLRLRRQVNAARRLGQYTLVEKLGEGGMGTVYRAHHALLRRPTAIKLLDPARSSPSAIARFESEVQLTSALTHPNTVTVYDYGRSPEGIFYYAMEYIEGITIQELVNCDGPQPPARVVAIVTQICAALAEAHSVGLVHRDVKPANVMICKRGGVADFVKVLDFGLVKDLTVTDSELSQQVALIGTPLYVAPEVALRNAPIDARADIYALGALTYFMLAATPVFNGKTAIEVCMKHVTEQPEPLAVRMGRSQVPALEALVMQCLAKDPADRPRSAAELRQALEGLDLPRWTDAEAQVWWEERSETLTQRRQAGWTAPEASARTLEIDRGRRTPWRSLRARAAAR